MSATTQQKIMVGDVLAALRQAGKKVRGGQNGQWQAQCPAHEDRNASLSIGRGEDDKPLVKCHAGCDFQQIIDALGLASWQRQDVPPRQQQQPQQQRRIVATYDYCDGGTLLYQEVRYDPKDFRQRQTDGKGGWIWNLNGVRRVLYNLEAVKRAPLDEDIYILEGGKDVERAKADGLTATTTAQGAASWGQTAAHACEVLRGRHVVIVKDADDSGDAYAEAIVASLSDVAASLRVIDLPGLEHRKNHGEDYSDWRDKGHTVAELKQLASQAPDVTPPWDEAIPLPNGVPPVAPLDDALLPEPIRDWVWDCAERMQVPPDFIAAGAVVMAGSLIGRRVGIYPKRQDDWLVVPNTWGAIVGRPSVQKSPALAEALKPLARLDVEAEKAYRAALEDYEREMIAAEAKKSALKEDIKKSAKKARGKLLHLVPKEGEKEADNVGDLDSLTAELTELTMPTEPTRRRFKTEDTTTEKLAELLIQNPTGLLQHRDELTGWLRTLDKAGREGDRAFYLEAWNGTGSYHVDRIGRGSLTVPALCVSILGSIQPGPLATYVYETHRGGAGDDGLLQRFQVLVWPDISPTWRNVDRYPNKAAKNRAYAIFQRLAVWQPLATADDTDDDGIPGVRFSEAAQAIFNEWRESLEARLRSGEMTQAMEAHLAKYRSLMPSLALIFHAIEVADCSLHRPAEMPDQTRVGDTAASQAVLWCDYLETHAQRLYASVANAEHEGARALLAKIERGDVPDGCAVRDIYRHQWAKLTTPEEVNTALKALHEYGWVRLKDIVTGGRPTQVVRIHPTLRQRTPHYENTYGAA